MTEVIIKVQVRFSILNFVNKIRMAFVYDFP